MRAIELRMLDQPVLAELSEAPERYAATQGLCSRPMPTSSKLSHARHATSFSRAGLPPPGVGIWRWIH
jgi:hypothetical protein